MDIEQMRIRMGEMEAEIERLNSAWQVQALNRKDLIIAKQESENDRLKAENARLQSIIDELQKRFMDASVDRNLLQGVINEQQSPAVAVPDSCLKQQNLPIEKLLEEYTHEGCDFTDTIWVNSASLRYVESMEDGQLKCLIYSLINLQSPRITEQDVLLALEGFHAMYNRHAWRHFYASWIKSAEYGALLNKLNAKSESVGG